jgi:hypothetical protein
MSKFLLLIALAAPLTLAQSPLQLAQQEAAEKTAPKSPQPASPQSDPSSLENKIEQIAASGRVLQIGETSSERLQPAMPLTPGAPPILAFRYFDGKARHRFGDLDLVMDDAGH